MKIKKNVEKNENQIIIHTSHHRQEIVTSRGSDAPFLLTEAKWSPEQQETVCFLGVMNFYGVNKMGMRNQTNAHDVTVAF